MKKIFAYILILLSYVGFSQNDTSHKEDSILNHDTSMLPQAGDWSLGVNLSDFLSDPNDNTRNGFDVTSINSVRGKYFLSKSRALRAGATFNIGSDQIKLDVQDNASTQEDAFVIDIEKRKNTNVSLSFGLEERRGKSRIQIIYGVDLFISYIDTNSTFEYGNEITTSNQSPSFINFGNSSGAPEPEVSDQLGGRIIEENLSATIVPGIRTSFGAEYFIAPKFSLGAELYFGASYQIEGNSSVTYEFYDPNTNSVREASNFTENDRFFDLGLTGASAFIFYYF